MYVPPYDSLLRGLGSSAEQAEKLERIAIPVKLLKLLLQLAVASSDFDEKGYLRENPDVQDAVASGEVESALLHYIGYGYFEGRQGGAVPVEEVWYLQQNPDVAAAIKDGQIPSAIDHFNSVGAAEGRSPNADQEEIAAQWKTALLVA